MRLPGIEYNAPRQMRTDDISLPLQVAESYSRASDAGARAMGQLMSVAGDIVNQELKFQVNNADYAFRKGESEWLSNNQNKDFYDPSELPEDLQTLDSVETVDEQGNTVQRIPKHEVFPELYKRELNRLLETSAGKIAAPGIRENWRMDMSLRGNQVVNQVTAENVQLRKKEIQNIESTRVGIEISEGNYDVAESLIAGSTLAPYEKQAKFAELAQKREAGTYASLMTEQNAKGISQASAYLRSPEYNGRLDEFDRLRWASALDQKYAAMHAGAGGASSVDYKILKKNIRNTISALNMGVEVDPDRVAQLFESGMGAVAAKDPGLMMDFQRSVQTQAARSEFLLRNPLAREQELLAAESSAMDEGQALMVADLRKAHESALVAQKADTISYAAKTGVVKVDPVQWGSDNFVESLAARKKSHDVAREVLGTSTGLLTNDEIPVFRDFMNKIPLQAKLATMAQVNEALGDEAPFFYEQFKDKGFGSLPQAGQLVSEGALDVAGLVLEGGDKRRSDMGKSLVSGINENFIPAISRKIGSAFPNTDTRDSTINSVLDVYASMAYEEGDLSGALKNDRLDKAVSMVTGGVIEFNGKRIQSPKYGMPQSSFEEWVDRLDPSIIDDSGGAKGYDSAVVLRGIQSGEISLESRSRNSYYLKDKSNGRFIANAAHPNEPLVFMYNEFAKTGKPASMMRRISDNLKPMPDARRGNTDPASPFTNPAGFSDAEAESLFLDLKP